MLCSALVPPAVLKLPSELVGFGGGWAIAACIMVVNPSNKMGERKLECVTTLSL
jgi:hypothetical protein